MRGSTENNNQSIHNMQQLFQVLEVHAAIVKYKIWNADVNLPMTDLILKHFNCYFNFILIVF